MGLLDRWFGKNKSASGDEMFAQGAFPNLEAAPPQHMFEPDPPEVQLGRITALDVDGVGRILLDDGTELRFGRSACRGFDPVVEARVNVVEVGAHPLGGQRATHVRAARGSEAELDRLLDAQAQRLGLVKSESSAARDALTLGTLTFLLTEHLPEGRGALRKLLTDAGVLNPHVTLNFAPHPALDVHGHLVQMAVGHDQLPITSLNLSKCDASFQMGKSFVSFMWSTFLLDVGKPMLGSEGQARLSEKTDAVSLVLEDITRKLAPLCRGIVMHREGNLVLPMKHFH